MCVLMYTDCLRPKLSASVIGWGGSYEFQLTNHRQRTALVADTVHTALTHKRPIQKCEKDSDHSEIKAANAACVKCWKGGFAAGGIYSNWWGDRDRVPGQDHGQAPHSQQSTILHSPKRVPVRGRGQAAAGGEKPVKVRPGATLAPVESGELQTLLTTAHFTPD